MFSKTLKALLVGSTVLAGASAANAETFRWAFQGDAQTLDPHGLFETLTLGFQGNIYEGLVKRNDKMEIVGALAESWENIEPTVWRFKLRPGVKFHNGNDLKSDDVVFSVNRLNTEGSDMKVVAALIKEAKVVDDLTVDIITPTPNPILPSIPTPPDTLSVAAEGVLDRVANLPIEELMDRVIHLVGDVNAILANEDTKAMTECTCFFAVQHVGLVSLL